MGSGPSRQGLRRILLFSHIHSYTGGLAAKLQAEKRSFMQDLLRGNRRVTALLEQAEGTTV